LRELSEGAVVSGVDLSRAEAAALNGTKLVSVTPEAHGWRVAAGQWVGAVRCGDLEVRVASKVGAVKVLELIARAHGIRRLNVDAARLGLADDADLSAVLAVLFEREAQSALALRPPRGYRTEDQSLSVVRGRIRLVDQELRRFGALTPIEVTVDEWTIDTDENRRLRAATRVLLSLPGVPGPVIAGLRRVDRMLGAVQATPRGSRAAPWKATRLNTHLHRLLRLSDLVLGGGSVEHRAGPVVAHGFALNMAWVFEALVAQLLREQCQADGTVRLLPKKSYDLDTLGALTIEPDLVIMEGSRPIVVADTKYKLLDDKGKFPNADAYQLVTYGKRLGLPVGHLVYTDAGAAPSAKYVIQGAELELHLHALELRAPLADIEQDVRRLHESMLTTAHRQSVAQHLGRA
jgi:5-methylcytosine-specific restriction enzyme subunit McrC